MSPMIWVILLLVIGLAVMVLEVFIPSGGILGFVSVASLLAALGTAFLQIGAAAGMTVLGITVITVPLVLAAAFRWFPETPLGRRVLPPPPDPADVLPDAARRRRLRDLVGRKGIAVNELLPWGSVQVDDVLVDSMSESGPITAGTIVEVSGVQGMSLVVRRVESGRGAGDSPVHPASSNQADRSTDDAGQGGDAGGSRLSPTLEAFEFEEFDPPRA